MSSNFNFASGNLFIDNPFGSQSDSSGDLHNIFGMERPDSFGETLIILLQENDLRKPVPIPQIDKKHTTMIPHSINPPGKSYRLTIMFLPQFPASFCS